MNAIDERIADDQALRAEFVKLFGRQRANILWIAGCRDLKTANQKYKELEAKKQSR